MAQSNEKRYFNSYTTAYGYLNAIEFKDRNHPDTKITVRVSALIGPEDKINYEHFKLTVRGDARTVVAELNQYLDDDKNKILVTFKASNCRAFPYEVKEGSHKGELRAVQSGYLLAITKAKVNGQVVFEQADNAE